MRNAPNADAHRTSTTDVSKNTHNGDVMNDRDICNIVNQMRRKIAKNNGIDFRVNECTVKGDCPDDCDKMASELEYLEEELERIQAEGGKINLRGVFDMVFDDLPKRTKAPIDLPVSRNPEKLEKLLENPELSNLPPRYLDSLLD